MTKVGPKAGYRYGQLRDIQEHILKSRGLTRVRADPTKSRQHVKLRRLEPTILDPLKTSLMRLLEIRLGKPIEDMLLSGTEDMVAVRLGIDKSTVSKWIKKLHLRIISCEICSQSRPSCLEGWCWRFDRPLSVEEGILGEQSCYRGLTNLGK